jgi:hypothetical protein
MGNITIAVFGIFAVLTSAATIGSGHIALAVSRNGQQDCGNSCTGTGMSLSPSNIITGSGLLTPPSPSPSLSPSITTIPSASAAPSTPATPTYLTLTIRSRAGNTFALEGRLMSNNQGMEGAIITFTGKEVLQHPDIRGPIISDITLRDIENGKPLTAVTRINGEYGPVIGEARVISGDPNSLVSITAHYGGEGIAPSSATLPLRAPPT